MGRVRTGLWLTLALATCAAAYASPQEAAAQGISVQPQNSPVPSHGPAETLYEQLRTVGLSQSRVYRIREASIDRAELHFTLNDGTIAFTEDVMGRVTGAFFEGDGEVLLIPPNRAERASMSLFTGAAILEEKFDTAYFRFNDDTYGSLQSFLRPADEAPERVTQWDQAERNLAQEDALRLLMTFSNFLPIPGEARSPEKSATRPDSDRMLHARIHGLKLGTFDVRFDSMAGEQIWAGQVKIEGGEPFYDLWTSFSSVKSRPAHLDSENGISEEDTKADIYNLSHYQIRSEVKPPTTLESEAELTMHVRHGGQRTVLFELSRVLQVKKVEADGRPIEFIHNQSLEGTQLARRGNDVVAVIFPHPLRIGDQIKLRFEYGGTVLSEAGGGLLYVGTRGIWYPNRGPAMSNFDLEFHYPPGWTLLATGKRAEVASGDPSGSTANIRASDIPREQVSRWISERPIPFAGFNLGKYSRIVAHAGTATVEAYATSGLEREFPKLKVQEDFPQPPGPPGIHPRVPVMPPAEPSPALNAQSVAQTSARALTYFARYYGPYPYSSLTLTQMPGSTSQGWPGLVFLSSLSFLTEEEKSRLRLSPIDMTMSNAVIAHETAHQWWGDLVLWNGYRDQWIVEALANYSALMLLQSESPSHFRAVMDKYREDLLQQNKNGKPLMEAGPVTLGARLSSSQFPNGYTGVSYGRGTWLFHMLRCMMLDASRQAGTDGSHNPGSLTSDEPFTRTLRKIRERYQGESISTQELLHMFEGELPPSLWYEGHKSLDWFYQGWINGTSIPRFELHGVKYTDKPGATTVSGTILQKDAPEELVTSLPLYGLRAGKRVFLRRVFAEGPTTEFHVSAPAGTRKIVLDPYQVVLSRSH